MRGFMDKAKDKGLTGGVGFLFGLKELSPPAADRPETAKCHPASRAASQPFEQRRI
jgi:hypothetical protein